MINFIRRPKYLKNTGLLLLRIGIGIMFMGHGWPKLIGGPERWTKIGESMGNFGIHFLPEFWGFMAAVGEFGGGLLLLLGLFHRVGCILLFATMIVASAKHILAGDGFAGYSHAVESAILFFSLYFIGPGKYSLGK